MLKRGIDRDDAVSNFFVVDASTGVCFGPIPVMELYDNDALAEKLDNPHKIPPEDQQLEHGFLKNKQAMYRVKRTSSKNSCEEIIYGGYLSHHGIQGQKWGHRNGPPYPLKPEMHSKAEKVAQKSRKDSNKEPTVIGSTRGQKTSFKERRQNNKAAEGQKFLDSMDVDLSKIVDRERSKKGGTSSEVITDFIFALFDPVSAISLGTKAAISAYENHKVKNYLKKRDENGTKDPKTGLYLKSKEGDDKSDLSAVNPAVHNMNDNTKNNCMLCTTTYDLRKRGFDVTAQLDSQGYNLHDLKKWYPKATVQKNNRYGADGRALNQKEYVDKTIKNLLKQGDGARGNIMVQFNGGGGHSIIYEIQNGKVVFKDGQINKVYSSPEKFLNRTTVNAFARLDNVEPNYEEIKKHCVR